MRLKKVRIQNYRSIKDETVHFDPYTCLVGPNGAGKSNILRALCMFFRADSSPLGTEELSKEDFHRENTAEPVTITLTFDDLSPEAKGDLADYVRQDQLIVSAVATWDPATERAPILQHGSRLVMPALKVFFAQANDKQPVKVLKETYTTLRTQFPDLPDVSTKADMEAGLRAYESAHPDACQEVPSKDEFYGFSKGQNRLEKYIQFLYVPAVKDAISEQQEEKDTVIGQLLNRAVRSRVSFADDLKRLQSEAATKYTALLAQKEPELLELSRLLTERIQEWATPDASLLLHWGSAGKAPLSVVPPTAQVKAGQGGFKGELYRMGHGMQRSFLLAILQVLASSGAAGGPTLLLACEEPELYQHPPQIRHLASVLQKLAQSNSQIIVTTHSPLFVTGREFENVRMARRSAGGPTGVTQATLSKVSELLSAAKGEAAAGVAGRRAKLHESLDPGLSEMFFCEKLVLVEGSSDRAYILASMEMLGHWEEYRRLGIHIVPSDGKNQMTQPHAVAQLLGIPTYIVFDADSDQNGTPDKLRMHELDNKTLLGLAGHAGPGTHPWAAVWQPNCTMWSTNIEDAVRDSVDADVYRCVKDRVLLEFGQDMPKLQKDSLYVYRLLEELDAEGQAPPVLKQLCEAILRFFATATPATTSSSLDSA